MTAGAVAALTFRKLKQITIRVIGRRKNIARFPCDITAFLFYIVQVCEADLVVICERQFQFAETA